MERWKEIPGWPGYEVSSEGRVISFKRKTPKIKTPFINREGYHRVALYDNDRHWCIGIHRLVLITFKGLMKGKEASHRDGDPSNNRLSNLSWKTRKSNEDDKKKYGTRPVGTTHYKSIELTKIQIASIIRMCRTRTQKEVAKKFNISQSFVSKIFRGEGWQFEV